MLKALRDAMLQWTCVGVTILIATSLLLFRLAPPVVFELADRQDVWVQCGETATVSARCAGPAASSVPQLSGPSTATDWSAPGYIRYAQSVPASATDLGPTVRFNSAGVTDARNSGSYAAQVNVPYTPGTTYHIRMVINVPAHTYSDYALTGTAPGQTLALNFAFRTEQQAVTALGQKGMYAVRGALTLCQSSESPCVTSDGSFKTQTLPTTETGAFTAYCDTIPHNANMDDYIEFALNTSDRAERRTALGARTGDISMPLGDTTESQRPIALECAALWPASGASHRPLIVPATRATGGTSVSGSNGAAAFDPWLNTAAANRPSAQSRVVTQGEWTSTSPTPRTRTTTEVRAGDHSDPSAPAPSSVTRLASCERSDDGMPCASTTEADGSTWAERRRTETNHPSRCPATWPGGDGQCGHHVPSGALVSIQCGTAETVERGMRRRSRNGGDPPGRRNRSGGDGGARGAGVVWRDNIRELRYRLSPDPGEPLSQQRLSELLGVSLSTVARWEAGGRPDKPMQRKLLRLGRVLTALGDLVKPEHRVTFLRSPHSQLLGLSPIGLLDSDDSASKVIELVEAVESGAFS